MATLTRRDFESYALYAKRLSADIEHLLEDLRYRAEGGTIRVAVDFSEIHAFLAPGHLDESWLWPGLDHASLPIVEHSALSEVLTTRPDDDPSRSGWPKPILLAPYALEFRNFLAQLRDGLREDLMKRVPAALDSIEQASMDPEAGAMHRLAEECSRERRSLSDNEVDEVTAFLEKHAGALLGLVRTAAINPLARARAFLERQPFGTLDSVVAVPLRGNEPEIEQRFARLRQLRGARNAGASYIDSLALEMVRRANLDLARRQRRERVLFVTRSTFISRLLENEQERQLWSPIGAPVLRHPRCFAPLAWHAGRGLDASIEELEATRASLDLFWASAQLRLKGTWTELTSNRRADAPLIQTVTDLKTQIVRLVQIGGTINESQIAPEAQIGGSDSRGADVLRLLGMLRDRSEIFKAVADRMSEINQRVDRDHELLGLYLQSHHAIAGQWIDEDVSLAWSRSGAPALTTRFGEVAYPVRFNSEGLRRWAERLRGTPDLTRDNVWEFLASATRDASDHYETLLFMAYVLAIVRQWPLAEAYCRRALLSAEHHNRAERHEADFFLAVCCRRTATSPDALREALAILDRISSPAAARSNDGDIRLLAERGAILLTWAVRAGEDRHSSWQSQDAPQLADAVDVLERVRAHSLDDEALRVSVLNNLCYAYLHNPRNRRLDAGERTLSELFTALTNIEADTRRWPVQFTDTIAWGNLVLHADKLDAAAAREWISALEAGLQQEPSGPDRDVMTSHLNQLRARLHDRPSARRTPGARRRR